VCPRARRSCAAAPRFFFGILLIVEPFIGAVVLTLWIGAYALVFGALLLVLAFQLNSKREARLRKEAAA
jgi:uncharacterized membrane protein HdeD (DUF308 family)